MARKKKQTTVGQDASQVPIVQAKAVSVAPVALLIDGENVAIPDLLAHVLVEAGRMGGVTIRHVYGNWSAPVMQGWKKYLEHYGLEAKGNRTGPNATDIALVIGAMDLLYQGIKHFCLVAGDRDYVPLVERLRKDGCTVLVIGSANASKALQETSSRFLSTEQLLPGAAPAVVPALAPSASMDALRTVLLTAYQAAVEQNGGTEWLPLSQLGICVRQCDATFEEKYGKTALSTLLKQCGEAFETRMEPVGKGQREEVRRRLEQRTQ
jgi:hypothetical protein